MCYDVEIVRDVLTVDWMEKKQRALKHNQQDTLKIEEELEQQK